MKPKVVVVCGDPGGAAAVAPVILELERDGRVEVKPFAYYEAMEILRKAGIDFDVAKFLYVPDQMDDADLLFTGTSTNCLGIEKWIIDKARKKNIPSLSLIDFWSNYV